MQAYGRVLGIFSRSAKIWMFLGLEYVLKAYREHLRIEKFLEIKQQSVWRWRWKK